MLDEEKTEDQSQAPEADPNAQDTASAEGADKGETQDVEGQTKQQGDDQQAPEGQEDFIGETPKELEPFKKEILNKFYAKTRELAKERHTIEAVKKDAETLQQLMGYKPFQDWYNAQKSGGQPQQQQGLSEEEMEQLRTDPAKFNEFITKKLDALVEQKYGTQMKTVQEKAEDMELAKEFESTKETYGDEFEIAHKSGELDPYYDKGLDFETAYATWKLKSSGKTSPKKQDAKTVDRSKQGMSEKPSPGQGKLPQIKMIKAKGFEDAFDQAFAAHLKGEKIKIER